MPQGKRKRGLDAALAGLLDELFGGRVLAFDEQAAKHYAGIIGNGHRAGTTIGWPTVRSPPSRPRTALPWLPATGGRSRPPASR